jgi:hypothetical protein
MNKIDYDINQNIDNVYKLLDDMLAYDEHYGIGNILYYLEQKDKELKI